MSISKSQIIKVPKKQRIPIMLCFALVLWTSSALTYSSARIFMIDSKICISDIVSFISNNHLFINKDIFKQDILLALLIVNFLLIIVLIIVMIIKSRSIFTISIVIALMLGINLGLMGSYNIQSNMTLLSSCDNKNDYSFNVISDQKEGMYTNNADAEVIVDGKSIKTKIQFDKNFEEVHAGDIINSKTKFSLASENQVENYWQNGITANSKLENPAKLARNDILAPIFVYRNHLIETIRNYDKNESEEYSEPEQLLNAIICGQRIDLNKGEVYEDFKCAGLAHIVAVSGAHLSLVSSLLLIALKKLRFKKRTIIIAQSIFILLFIICAAIPISALRAALMAYIAIFSFFGKRRPASLNSLGVCIIILIVLNIETSVSISFALSAGATLGIVMFSILFEYWILRIAPKCPSLISSALSLTFSANICSLPLSISVFSQIPLISPISNIICTPIFTILCGFGLIACIFCSIFSNIIPLVCSALMWITYEISKLMIFIVKILSNIPYSSIAATLNIIFAIVISIIICCLLYYLWPKDKQISTYKWAFKPITISKNVKNPNIFKNKKTNLYVPLKPNNNHHKIKIIVPAASCIVLLLISFFLFKQTTEQTTIKALDVGQGDSILLKSKGHNFMIDTGNQDNLLKMRLAEEGINHLDGLMITHPDDDHCGSMDVIQSLVEVDNIYVSYELPSNNDKNCKKLMEQSKKIVKEENIQKMHVGNKIHFGEIELEIIWPDKYKDNGGNCDSLCALANIDVNNDNDIDANALFCGDAEHEEIDQMIKKQRLSSINIYKCGHHGSKNAINEDAVRKLCPKITLVSVGAKNKYGHPSKSTIDKLSSVNSEIYRTDQKGTITLTFGVHKIDIATQK